MASRQADLLKLLEQHGSLSLTAISSLLHVSMSTARRDVIYLEKQKLVTRSNAEVTLLNRKKHGVSLSYSIKSHEKEKKTIARLASDLVQNKSTIFLASGSATFFMIPFLSKKKILQL